MTTEQVDESNMISVQAATYAQFQIPGHPYSVVKMPLDIGWIEYAVDFGEQLKKALDNKFGEQQAPAPQQRSGAPQRQQGPSGGQPQGRAERYPVVPGKCDNCGGPVGRYPKTGQMRSDKAVCLGTCKDGQYVHTAFWLDEEPVEPF